MDCYVKSNTTQREHRKRMVDILGKSTRVYIGQRLADQSRMILKEGCFSNFEIIEICEWVNSEEYEQNFTTRIKTLNFEKQKLPNRL